MRTPADGADRWLLPAVFGAWALALAFLLATGRFTGYLRPEFGLLLAVALFVALGFSIAAAFRKSAGPVGFSEITRAVVLLVPIVFLAAMPAAKLGDNAFKNRFLGPAAISKGRLYGDRNPAVVGGAPSESVTLVDLFTDPGRYDGRRVSLVGMILRDEALRQHFGGRDTAVYRFYINCCAADALPLAVAVDAGTAAGLEKEQWVIASGVFTRVPVGTNNMPFLEGAVISPTAPPKNPYLF